MAKKDLRAAIAGIRIVRERLKKQKLQPFSKRLHATTSRIWRQAGDAFVRETVSRMLVETGMSAASLLPLSRVLKTTSTALVMRHIASKQKVASLAGIKTFPAGARGPGRRSVASGKAAGQGAYRFTVGTPNNPVFTFQFVTTVFQHAFHDDPDRSGLETVAAGFAAFKEVIDTRMRQAFRLSMREFVTLKPTAKKLVGSQLRSVTGSLDGN